MVTHFVPMPYRLTRETASPRTRYGFRSFDRQWIIPDGRVINRPNPTLWEGFSDQQVFLDGIGSTLSAPSNGSWRHLHLHLCDLHHYQGLVRRSRTYPLWADNQAASSNVKGAFLDCLAEHLGTPVSGQQIMAYLAAVMAHPGYARRFRDDLVQPGLRLPLTGDAGLFAEAVALGEEVIWLHTFGERYADPPNARPTGPPRLPTGEGPLIPRDGAIPSDPARMPDRIDYDAAKRRLLVGEGFIDNVPPAMSGSTRCRASRCWCTGSATASRTAPGPSSANGARRHPWRKSSPTAGSPSTPPNS